MNRKTKLVDRLREPIIYVLVSVSVSCLSLILVRDLQTGHSEYPSLFPNLLIAWIPLLVSFFALGAIQLLRGVALRLCLVISGNVWLAFVPNDSYLLTDFVHILANNSYRAYPLDNLLLWYDIILFFLYSFCGLLLGFQSTRYFHEIVVQKLSSFWGWSFVISVSYLTALGVYLGRLVRLNSWDVLFHPARLVHEATVQVTTKSLSFTLLFGTFLLAIYSSFYTLFQRKRKAPA